MQPFSLTTHRGTYRLLPGVLDDSAKTCFTCGHCHSFALAVHKLTGWPLFGFQSPRAHSRGDTPYHVAVQMPNGDFLDIEGTGAFDSWVDRYNYSEHEYFPYTEREVKAFCKKDYRQHDIADAMPFAQEVLMRYTKLPVQNRIPFKLKK